jgi:hypothetical protein
MLTPIADSYWVVEGKLLAGEYPGAKAREAAEAKLLRFLDFGIDFFVDLTEANEHGLEPYDDSLNLVAGALGRKVTHRRMPIRDLGTAPVEGMMEILDAIDAALGAHHIVYAHCWGGVGRTGTVVGCYLVRHGMTGAGALAHIEMLRRGTPDGWKASPETDRQRAMVLAWRPGH